MKNQETIWDNIYTNEEDKWKLESKFPELFKNKSVLELGAGNGKSVKSILSQSPKSLIAIDFSQQAINIIKKKFPDIESIKANILNLPFKDSSFDIVVCNFILNNIQNKDKNKAVSEIYRVLNSKGILLFSDFGEGDYRIKEKRQDNLNISPFNESQLRNLFSVFNIKELEQKTSSPIRTNPKLKRQRIFMLAEKP